MSVFDLSEVGEGKVRYGDGCLWYKGAFANDLVLVRYAQLSIVISVVLRLVVFRPFASEVILAKVKSSDEEGIRCTWLDHSPCEMPSHAIPSNIRLL